MNQGNDTRHPSASTKEERLAAKLRENLRRRKAQGREMRESEPAHLPKTDEPG